MSFKDKVNDAIKDSIIEANIADLIKQEQDKQWFEHGGPFGRPVFGNIDGNGNGESKSKSKSKSTI